MPWDIARSNCIERWSHTLGLVSLLFRKVLSHMTKRMRSARENQCKQARKQSLKDSWSLSAHPAHSVAPNLFFVIEAGLPSHLVTSPTATCPLYFSIYMMFRRRQSSSVVWEVRIVVALGGWAGRGYKEAGNVTSSSSEWCLHRCMHLGKFSELYSYSCT